MPARKLALGYLPFDFQPDQQKEDGHQPVVDPEQQRLGKLERSDLDDNCGFEEVVIEPFQGRVGQDQRQHGGAEQQEAACRLELQEFPQERPPHHSSP